MASYYEIETSERIADEVLWFGLLSLQNSSQLGSDGINNPVDVLFSVVDVRRESHSVTFLGGYTNVVVFVQYVVEQHTQLCVGLACLAQTFAFATVSGGVHLVLELDNYDAVVLAQSWWRLNLEHRLAELPEHFVQAVPQPGGQCLDPLLDHVKANKLHQIGSVQHPDEVGVVTLANHLKLGSILNGEWNTVGVIWEGGWRLHLSVVPDVFGREIGDTLSLHVQDTSLLRTQEPLVAASAVAVTVHVIKVMIECAPGLCAIHMYMDIPVSLVDLLHQTFGGQARTT